MSAAEALRRCPQRRLPPTAARALPAVLARGLGHRGARSSRASSARASTRATSTSAPSRPTSRAPARSHPRSRQPFAGARASRARSASGRRRSSARSRPTAASPAASPSSRPARRRASSPRSRCALLPGVGPRAEARLRTAGVDTIGALASLADAELRTLLPGTLGPLLRNRARGVDPRDLDLELEPVSVSAEDTFPRDLDRSGARCTTRSDASPSSSPSDLGNAGLSGRTVTAKLRYADFSIRTRSTTLPAAVDDATRHRRRGLRPPRPRAPRPSRRAATGRRRRVRALALPATESRRVVESVGFRLS